MIFQEITSDMPSIIYNGYKFPQSYAVFGKTDIHTLNENNSSSFVYVGSRFDIEKIIKEVTNRLEDYDNKKNDFIVIGIWDNHVEKNNDDYIMISTIISHEMDSPLEYMKIPQGVHQLTDPSTSETDAWIAWTNLGEAYLYNNLPPNETKKVANVLLNNVSDDMINNFKNYTEDDFLISLLSFPNKLKL